jgi:hypothetical protein
MAPYPRLDRYTSAALILVGMMLVLHFAIVNVPERECVFDEYHYVPQARALLSGPRSHSGSLRHLFVAEFPEGRRPQYLTITTASDSGPNFITFLGARY